LSQRLSLLTTHRSPAIELLPYVTRRSASFPAIIQQVRAVCDVTHSPSPTDRSEAPIKLLLLLLDSTVLGDRNDTRMIPGDVCC